MDHETIQQKSLADLKTIAGMLGIDVPEKITKAKLIKLIEGGDAAGETAAKAPAAKATAAKAPAASEDKPRRRGRPSKSAKAAAEVKPEPAPQPEPAANEVPAAPLEPAPAAQAEPEAATEAAPEAKASEPKASGSKKSGAKTSASGKRGRPRKNAAKKEEKPGRSPEAEAAAEPEPAEVPEEENKAAAVPEEGERAAEVAGKNGENGKKHEFSENSEEVTGLLDIMQDGYGFLRTNKYYTGTKDVFVAPTFIRKYALRTGDEITGRSRPQRDNDKYQALFYITAINGVAPEHAGKRRTFESLTPIYPDERITLETEQSELSTRMIDLIAPIGKGQRGLIVSPPKAGKTVLLKKIANAITTNYPDIKLIVLLIDERPEEVTDMRESIAGEVVSSTFDEMPERHIKVAEMVFERARRLVEFGNDVVILMDSLTRLARAYNITITPTGRSLSGGLDPGALYNPKRFFGAARNIRDGGSLTIVATALIDTGSKMDDVIYEEFKGTGNMELHLDRKLSEKRVFPAIDISRSGTRKEELLLDESSLNAIYALRKYVANAGGVDLTDLVVNYMQRTRSNEEFVRAIKTKVG